MAKILPVIMCGGSGTRVWPESRESLPKQFIPLIGDRSTFQSIITVVGDAEVFERPVVITNFDYRFRVAEQLKEVGAEATVLLEPERRDSAAAVGAAAAWAAARDPKAIVAILAADHVFQNEKRFVELCVQAAGGGGGRRDRHLRRDAGSSGDRLRVHSTRRTACRGSEGPPRRTVCREAGRGARKDLYRGGLSVEFRQLRVPRRHHAGGTEPVRAQRSPRRPPRPSPSPRRISALSFWTATPSPRRSAPRSTMR